jgi:hypothetical protein
MMGSEPVDYSTVAEHVAEYQFKTDDSFGVILARDFTEAKMELAKMLPDNAVADGAWGWVDDLDGTRFQIGETQ